MSSRWTCQTTGDHATLLCCTSATQVLLNTGNSAFYACCTSVPVTVRAVACSQRWLQGAYCHGKTREQQAADCMPDCRSMQKAEDLAAQVEGEVQVVSLEDLSRGECSCLADCM